MRSDRDEWLEADGLGGFASGTATGIRTRRYHALLTVATTPPTGRFVLVNGFDAWLETERGRWALSSQRYPEGVVYPDGAGRIESFEHEPWPRWRYRLEDGTQAEHEIFTRYGAPIVVLAWRMTTPVGRARLVVRPFLSGRDVHALHHENPAFRFDAERAGGGWRWHPYAGVPGIRMATNGEYRHEPVWYRRFLYEEERARGLDFLEDLASPGVLTWDLESGEAVWILGAADNELVEALLEAEPLPLFRRLRDAELRRRRRFPSPLHRAADAYLVRRGDGRSIVAGYPWFTDWGRDTFIALRGLCLATGRLDAARDVLLTWSGAVSEGMIPNRFLESEPPEYNAVDASLWFVVVAAEWMRAMARAGRQVAGPDRERLEAAIRAVLDGYARGTRFGIRLDEDALLAAGEPGVQLTWTDAKVGDEVVTPRIGKPVEVQALWLNALEVGCRLDPRWAEPLARGLASFGKRYWYEDGGYLYDVVDVDHRRGAVDAALRPNQVLAVGGLPMPLVEGERARRVVDVLETRLWTPLGLRSVSPDDPSYRGRYEGGVRERDTAYHQGTVWPWLAGPFVEAWVRTRGGGAEVKREARARFLEPLLAHLGEAGLGHVSEIADGDPPHTPRGCPFQAWSVGELLRLVLEVLA